MDQLAKNDKERDQIQKERKASKQMEHQYWLEMCDSQHRYGTNLKVSLDPVLRFRQCFFLGGGCTLTPPTVPRAVVRSRSGCGLSASGLPQLTRVELQVPPEVERRV